MEMIIQLKANRNKCICSLDLKRPPLVVVRISGGKLFHNSDTKQAVIPLFHDVPSLGTSRGKLPTRAQGPAMATKS